MSAGVASPGSVSGAVSLAQIRIKLHEDYYFDALFKLLDSANEGSLKGSVVAKLFGGAGLDKAVLSEIWKIASQGNKGPLPREGFFIACRLVALAQNGALPSKQVLLTQLEAPLPKFGPEADAFYAEATKIASQPPPAAVAAAAPAPAAAGGWALTAQDKVNYSKFFTVADADGDKFVNGKEAKDFFSKSGLPGKILKDVWTLSDLDKDSKLTENEFLIAMHLIMKIRQDPTGQVPTVLPEELRASVLGTAPAPKKEESKIDLFASAPTGIGKKAIPDDLLSALNIAPVDTTPAPDLLMGGDPMLEKRSSLKFSQPSLDGLSEKRGSAKMSQPLLDDLLASSVKPTISAPKSIDIATLNLGSPAIGPSAPLGPLSAGNSPILDANTADLDKLRAEVQAKKLALEQSKLEVERSRKEKKALSGQAEFLQTQLEGLQGQLDDYDRMLLELKTELDTEKQKVDTSRVQIDAVRSDITSRVETLNENKKAIATLREERRRLEREHEDILQEVSDEDLSISMITKEHSAMQSRIQQLRELIDNQRQILETRREQREALEKEKSLLTERLRAANTELKRLKEESSLLNTEVTELTSIGDELKTQIKETQEAAKLVSATKPAVVAQPKVAVAPAAKPVVEENPFNLDEDAWPEDDFNFGEVEQKLDQKLKPASVHAAAPAPVPATAALAVSTPAPAPAAVVASTAVAAPASVPAAASPKAVPAAAPVKRPDSIDQSASKPAARPAAPDLDFDFGKSAFDGADDFPSFDDPPKAAAPASGKPAAASASSAFDMSGLDDFPSFDDAPPAKPAITTAPLNVDIKKPAESKTAEKPAEVSSLAPPNAAGTQPAEPVKVHKKSADDPFGDFASDGANFDAFPTPANDDWNF